MVDPRIRPRDPRRADGRRRRGAKVDIYREIGALADAGAAIVVVSSDLLELIGLTDRILVFYRGKIVADVQSAETDQDRLLSLLTTGRNAEESRDAVA